MLGERLREPRMSELGGWRVVSAEVPKEWYLVLGEGLRGREREQAPRLPVQELGWGRERGGKL